MYEKVWKKIVGITKFIAVLCIAITICFGALVMESSDETIIKCLGIVIMFVGSLLSCLSFLIACGFDRLIENSDKLVAMQSEAQEEEKTSN